MSSQEPDPSGGQPSPEQQMPSLNFLNTIVLMMYPAIAAQMVILLESIRTVPAEIRMYRRAWIRKRFNAAEILFFAIKYMSLFAYICDALIENSSYIKSGGGCYAIHTMYYTFMLLSVTLVAIAIAWRCYIVFNCNRKILYGLGLAVAGHIAITCFTIKKQHKTSYLEDGFCQVAYFDILSVWTFAAPYYLLYNVIYDATVTAIATRRLLQNAKGLKGMSGITGITKILLYNNMHYVAIVCSINFMEFIYLVSSDGTARSLLSISCAIQIITGMGLLISEQDAVHQSNRTYITGRSGANHGPNSGSNAGSNGVQLHQSQYVTASSARTWLPSPFHPRSAEATTSTFYEHEKQYEFSSSNNNNNKNKKPNFHGITLSVHQHCSDDADVTDIERGYPNLTGKNDHSSDDLSPAAAGWTSTPLSPINQTPIVEPLFFLPHQQNDDLETRAVAYPKLEIGSEQNLNYTSKMATNRAMEDVTLLTKMAEEGEKGVQKDQSDSTSAKVKHDHNLSISSIRAQAQLRKVEAYRNHEDLSGFPKWETHFPEPEQHSQQQLSPKSSHVKRKSVPSLMPEGKSNGSGEGPSVFEARLRDKPLPPAYSVMEDEICQTTQAGREAKMSKSNPPKNSNLHSSNEDEEEEDLNVTTGTFGGRLSAISTTGIESQPTGNVSSSSSSSRTQFSPPLGLALPAMVLQKNRQREMIQDKNINQDSLHERNPNELPSYHLQSNQPTVRRNQDNSHNRTMSESLYRGSMRSNPFFAPSD